MRTHAPWCDTELGPDFKVEPGVVHMTIFACWNFECWDEGPPAPVASVNELPIR